MADPRPQPRLHRPGAGVTGQDWIDMVLMIPAVLAVLVGLWAACALLFALSPVQ